MQEVIIAYSRYIQIKNKHCTAAFTQIDNWFIGYFADFALDSVRLRRCYLHWLLLLILDHVRSLHPLRRCYLTFALDSVRILHYLRGCYLYCILHLTHSENHTLLEDIITTDFCSWLLALSEVHTLFIRSLHSLRRFYLHWLLLLTLDRAVRSSHRLRRCYPHWISLDPVRSSHPLRGCLHSLLFIQSGLHQLNWLTLLTHHPVRFTPSYLS